MYTYIYRYVDVYIYIYIYMYTHTVSEGTRRDLRICDLFIVRLICLFTFAVFVLLFVCICLFEFIELFLQHGSKSL